MLRTIVINGYEIMMDDKQYNEVLGRAYEIWRMYSPEATKYDIPERYLALVIYHDFEQFLEPTGLISY